MSSKKLVSLNCELNSEKLFPSVTAWCEDCDA